jgi:hypothetical protein
VIVSVVAWRTKPILRGGDCNRAAVTSSKYSVSSGCVSMLMGALDRASEGLSNAYSFVFLCIFVVELFMFVVCSLWITLEIRSRLLIFKVIRKPASDLQSAPLSALRCSLFSFVLFASHRIAFDSIDQVVDRACIRQPCLSGFGSSLSSALRWVAVRSPSSRLDSSR